MNDSNPVFLTCTEIRQRLRIHPLAQSEVPTEHAVSFPLPTLRCGAPGYALFASPAVRVAFRPKEQGAPDRWWVLSARNGRLLTYAMCAASPFSTDTWAPIVLAPLAGTLAEWQAATTRVEKLIDRLAPAFFAGAPESSAARQELKQAIMAILPPELVPQYLALTPDFWGWLEVV